MNKPAKDLVEVGRQRVTKIGTSPYILLPHFLRRRFNVDYDDTVLFLQRAESDEVVIWIEKAEHQ